LLVVRASIPGPGSQALSSCIGSTILLDDPTRRSIHGSSKDDHAEHQDEP
jgi:hypothetical protein